MSYNIKYIRSDGTEFKEMIILNNNIIFKRKNQKDLNFETHEIPYEDINVEKTAENIALSFKFMGSGLLHDFRPVDLSIQAEKEHFLHFYQGRIFKKFVEEFNITILRRHKKDQKTNSKTGIGKFFSNIFGKQKKEKEENIILPSKKNDIEVILYTNLTELAILKEKLKSLNNTTVVYLGITDIYDISIKIYDFIKEHPEKSNEIRGFVDYYLPTTIKLIDSYIHLVNQGSTGENITNSKAKIENLLQILKISYEKQLDSLFEAKFLDISAEIGVIKNLLKEDGLFE
ncbi:MAG: 5-bromo-4-chloroindolyl phosphate hydrolysis family protein [Defluviitaleaceae bacterium]|nr:5-bromo-4-chloroindolyl phosphate hydrolysis family protein [Defluviitaleaceae bacterium]